MQKWIKSKLKSFIKTREKEGPSEHLKKKNKCSINNRWMLMIIQLKKRTVRKENLWRSVTVTRFTLQVAVGYEFIYYTRTLFFALITKRHH